MGRRTAAECASQPLTPRECELIQLLSQTGAGDKELAYRLGLTTQTVKEYFVRIKDKLGMSTRGESWK